MFKSFFKKDEPTPEQVQALQEANMALRVRMERVVRETAAQHFGQANEPVQSFRPIFEGQVAA